MNGIRPSPPLRVRIRVRFPSGSAQVHPHGQRRKKHPRPLADHLRRRHHLGLQPALRAQQRLHIPRQLFELHVAQADPEVTRRHVLQLVRLIENHHAGFRQNPRVGSPARLLPDRHIREEQMVIHNHHIALRRAASHLRDETAPVIRARLPQASLAARVQLRPHRARLRQIVDFHPIPGLRRLFPFRDRLVLRNLLEPRQNRLAPQRKQLVPAQVIRAPLHVANAQRSKERLQKRHILKKQLLLQILCPRRDDHPMPGRRALPQRWQQIRQRLPCPRSCLDNQVPLILEGALHRLRHLQLPPPKLVRQARPRQHSPRRKKIMQRGKRGCCLFGGGHGLFRIAAH